MRQTSLAGLVRGAGCLVLAALLAKLAWHTLVYPVWVPPTEPRCYALATEGGGFVEVFLYPDRRAVIRSFSETTGDTETVLAHVGGKVEEQWWGRLWRRESFFWFTGWTWSEEGAQLARLNTEVLARAEDEVQDPGLGQVGEVRTHPWTIHEDWLQIDQLRFVRFEWDLSEYIEVREPLEALAAANDRTDWCSRARSESR